MYYVYICASHIQKVKFFFPHCQEPILILFGVMRMLSAIDSAPSPGDPTNE